MSKPSFGPSNPDPETRRWWKLTDPCQTPLPDVPPGGNWSEMESLFWMA